MNQKTIATLISVEADSAGKLPERIHLLRTGTFETGKYGKLEITADDMQEFVSNFNMGYGRPGPEGQKGGLPVNIRHDKGGVAACWVHAMSFDGKNLWGEQLEWTGAGKAEVEAGNYKYFSSEFTPRCLGGFWSPAENALQKVRNVFTGAALTNIPMFNGNHGVMASSEPTGSEDEKQVIYINASDEEQERKMPTLDEVRVKDAANLSKEDKQVLADALVADANSLSADEKKKFFGIEASAETPKAVEASAVEGTEGLVSVEASEIKALADRVKDAEAKVEAANAEKTDLEKKVEAHAEILKKNQRKEIEASVKKHVARGAIVADQATKWADRIEADETMLEDLEKLPANKVVEAANIGAEDQGDGAVSATQQIQVKAQKLVEASQAKNESLSIGDAFSQVMKAEPELAKQYEKESKGKE